MSIFALATRGSDWLDYVQLNMGYPIELVSKRANATIPVIKQYYDQANPAEEFRERRRDAETELDVFEMGDKNEYEFKDVSTRTYRGQPLRK